ncbi:UPF0149 family protein [bacterium]|nr:UPF0149 family protein [bacterium]
MDERVLTNLNMALSEEEYNELDEFLLSDEAPEECMDISTLDGFLTALVIGPNTVMPSQWQPVVWGLKPGEEMVWESTDRALKILGLLHRLFNTIVHEFQTNPEMFEPVFYESNVSEKSITIYDEWCVGFMQGVDLSYDEWLALIKSEQHKKFFAPLSLFGTEEGWKLLEEQSEEAKVPHEEWAEMIRFSVISIHEYWLPFRKAHHSVKQQSLGNQVGRNEPCPCGSGKKFKKCCMN